MTITEKAICEVYTGIVFCAKDDIWAGYAYAERLLGRAVYTHEFAELSDKLKELSKFDFVKVCRNEPLGFELTREDSGDGGIKPTNIRRSDGGITEGFCACGTRVNNYMKFCDQCGKKLDWSENDG